MQININQIEDNLLCGHPFEQAYKKNYKFICGVCESFVDTQSAVQTYCYTDDYPKQRCHCNNTIIEKLKIKAMKKWLDKTVLSVKINDMVICELGFGGAHCLNHLNKRAKQVFGIEIITLNIKHAILNGFPEKNLYLFNNLPQTLPEKIDLWLFQDSFEHITKPAQFLKWVQNNSNEQSKILLIAPRADSLSQKIMSSLWIHRTPDHSFHWSYRGICGLFSEFDFYPIKKFFPLKYINMPMILAHISIIFRLKFPINVLERRFPDISFPFNIGEMGILFEKIQK